MGNEEETFFNRRKVYVPRKYIVGGLHYEDVSYNDHIREHAINLENLQDNLSRPNLSTNAIEELTKEIKWTKRHLNQEHNCAYDE